MVLLRSNRAWSPKIRITALLGVILIGLIVLAAANGAVPVPPATVARILLSRLPLLGSHLETAWTEPQASIILRLRLPRILLAVLVGSALATAGVAFQGVLQNPMADPYLIGVSSGAALGAALAIVYRLRFAFLGFGAVPVASFVGALISLHIAYNLARRGRVVPVINLILSGVATGAFFSALVSLVIFLGRERMDEVVFWMMGGLANANWSNLLAISPYIILGGAVVFLHGRELNALLLGDTAAAHLGIDVGKTRQRVLFAASLATAAAVSVSGIIGFVGLVVPHMARLAVGPDHRVLLPTAAVSGSILLLVADTAARTLLSPTEIPVGIVTALFGAPFFLYLLRRSNKLS
jgi:iron complex transport system permease protein